MMPICSFSKGRDELYRYTLMRDRVIIDRALKKTPYHSYFDLEVLLSSGLKSLVGDVKDGNRSGLSSSEKQNNMLEILNKNVNTARFVDANLEIGVPLPKLNLGKFKIDSAFFYNFNVGISLSISNITSPTSPSASVYIKKETKLGLDSYWQNNPSEAYGIRYYQLTRSDLLSVTSASQLATDGELFDLDELTREQVTYNFDVYYQKAYKDFRILLEVQEFKIMNGSSTVTTRYESRPLLHAQANFENRKGKLYIGIHQRLKYAFLRGMYLAYDYKIKEDYPFFVLAKLSNQYLTLNPRFETKYFKLNYKVKTPLENPQDELWHSTLHALNIEMPFF